MSRIDIGSAATPSAITVWALPVETHAQVTPEIKTALNLRLNLATTKGVNKICGRKSERNLLKLRRSK